ncbi:MAG: hypothetical protein QXW71_06630 [Thermoplasmata archaeon]
MLIYFFRPSLLKDDAVWIDVKKISNDVHRRTLTKLKDDTYLFKPYVAELLRSLRASQTIFDPVSIIEHRLVVTLNSHIGTGYVYEIVYEFVIDDIKSIIEKCPKEDLRRKLRLLHKKLSSEQKDDIQNKLCIGIGKCIAKTMSKELKRLSRNLIKDKLPVVFRTRVQVENNNKVRIVLWIPAPDESLINALLSQIQLPILRALILFL